MNVMHAIVLGLVQGLTEFLPVSSTAHLTLVENVLLKQSMPLAFDVLLHVGTLAALCIYFRRDIAQVMRGISGQDREGRQLAKWLFIAMIPTGVLALATKPLKEAAKDHIWVYGVCLLITAAFLWTAQRLATKRVGRPLAAMGVLDALAVGSIQGLGGGAGLSRSGSTICMGVFGGLSLPASARFSFLLGIPTIVAAAAKEGLPLVKALVKGHGLTGPLAFPPTTVSPAMLCAVGVVVSAIAGYGAVGLLDKVTQGRPRLSGFAVYCVLVGTFMIVWGLR